MDAVEIARHFEQALADVALTIAPHHDRVGSAVASYAEPGSWLNQCWNFGMHGVVTAKDVDEIIAFYDSHLCETKIGVATLADPSATKALKGRGFEIGDFINILVADLTRDQPTRRPIHPVPARLEIKRVDKTNDESIEAWAELSTRGFNEGNPAPTAEVWTAAKALRYDGVDGYVATIDGEPAAAAAVALNDSHGHRSAGLFATSVLPAFQRMGIQQQLISTRLERAQELGATFATIGSLPGIPTERNAARFGFRLTYVQAVFSRPYSPANG